MIEQSGFDLIIASNNRGKLNEFSSMLKPYFSRFFLLKDLGIECDVEETGKTFQENALIKARFFAERFPDFAVLSDDSGLIVDSLGGEPGVFTARYAGENATSDENIDKLLEKMKNIKDRRARFHCTLALITPKSKETVLAYGECEGSILTKREGKNGFAFDTVFYSFDLKKSFGNASSEEKNKVSHRFRALESLLTKINAKN